MPPKRGMGWLLEEKFLVLYMVLCFFCKFPLGVKVGPCRHQLLFISGMFCLHQSHWEFLLKILPCVNRLSDCRTKNKVFSQGLVLKACVIERRCKDQANPELSL